MLFCLPCLWPFLVAIFVAICACHKANICLWFFAQHICLPCLWRPPETRWSLHPHSVFKLSQGAELDLKRWERERELQKESEREFHERLHRKLHEILHTELNICKYGTQKENYTITLRRVISRKNSKLISYYSIGILSHYISLQLKSRLFRNRSCKLNCYHIGRTIGIKREISW